jgi:hypothetical protein
MALSITGIQGAVLEGRRELRLAKYPVHPGEKPANKDGLDIHAPTFDGNSHTSKTCYRRK